MRAEIARPRSLDKAGLNRLSSNRCLKIKNHPTKEHFVPRKNIEDLLGVPHLAEVATCSCGVKLRKPEAHCQNCGDANPRFDRVSFEKTFGESLEAAKASCPTEHVARKTDLIRENKSGRVYCPICGTRII